MFTALNYRITETNMKQKTTAGFRKASSNVVVGLFLKSVHATPNFVTIINCNLSPFKQKLIRFFSMFLLHCVECLCRVQEICKLLSKCFFSDIKFADSDIKFALHVKTCFVFLINF